MTEPHRPHLLSVLTWAGMICTLLVVAFSLLSVRSNPLPSLVLAALCSSGWYVFFSLRRGRYWAWVAFQSSCALTILFALCRGAGAPSMVVVYLGVPAVLILLYLHRQSVKTFCGVAPSQVEGWLLVACVGLVFVLPFFGVVLPLAQHDYHQQAVASSSFHHGDIKYPSAFAAKLRERADGASAYIYSKLRESTRQALAQWAGRGHLPSGLERAVVEDLNGIIRDPSVRTEAWVAAVSTRAETGDLLGRPLIGYDNAPLNRLLLEDAFPEDLSRQRHDRRFALVVSLNSWLVLVMTLYGIRVGIGLWRVEEGAVRNAQRVLTIRIAYTLAFTAALLCRFPREAWEWFIHGSGGSVFATGVAHSLWSVYLRFSKRVKATYH